MTVDDVIAALELPSSALVHQRVPKTVMVQNGAPTAADKRRINDGIDELFWVAALKPSSIGVAAWRDADREYLEIAVMTLKLRADAKAGRLVELIHRAIPYPVFLVSLDDETLSLSVAHKRNAQNEADRVVLDGDVVQVELSESVCRDDLATLLRLADRPRGSILDLYQGWQDSLEAIAAARITGELSATTDQARLARRRAALVEHERLMREIAQLRTQTGRESQMARRVELNLEIKRLEAALAEAQRQL